MLEKFNINFILLCDPLNLNTVALCFVYGFDIKCPLDAPMGLISCGQNWLQSLIVKGEITEFFYEVLRRSQSKFAKVHKISL